jgi:phosphatidylinositol dimannoside acyltransferase
VSDLPGYVVYRALSGAFGLLPGSIVRSVGRGLGRLLSYVAGDRRRMAERHMRRALGPEASARAVERAARGVFASYGRYWAELFWFRPSRKAEVTEMARVDGTEAVHAARAAGRGVIFALPHVGTWDVAGAVAESIGLPVMAVAEDLSNRRIRDWFVSTRRALGIDVVIGGGADTTKSLIRHLQGTGVVALVADRDVTGRGVEVEFFGEVTTMPGGPAALADRTGAAIFPVAARFAPRGRYHMVIEPELPLPDAATRQERIQLGTQAFATRVEQLIRPDPEQWHVIQPIWPSDREWLEARR